MRKLIPFVIAAVVVAAVIGIGVYAETTASGVGYGYGTGGTGPEPSAVPTVPPTAVVVPNTPSPTTEPTVVVPSVTPEATVDPLEGWLTLEVLLDPDTGEAFFPVELYDAWSRNWQAYLLSLMQSISEDTQSQIDLAIIQLRDAITEDSLLLFEGYAGAHSDRLYQFDQRLDELATAIAGLPEQGGPSNNDVLLYLAAMRGELQDLRNYVYATPTPSPATPTPVPTQYSGSGVVVETCNQCTFNP